MLSETTVYSQTGGKTSNKEKAKDKRVTKHTKKGNLSCHQVRLFA